MSTKSPVPSVAETPKEVAMPKPKVPEGYELVKELPDGGMILIVKGKAK